MNIDTFIVWKFEKLNEITVALFFSDIFMYIFANYIHF